MSSFSRITKHPITGKWERAMWLDDYYGKHRYGVKFDNGDVFPGDDYDWETKEDE